MSNKFCRFLSNGYSFVRENNDIQITPCCWYQGNHSREHLQSITDWTPGCQICKDQEDAGGYSFRQSSFEIIPELPDNSVAVLDIAVDFNCNAACVTCGPNASSTWSKHLSNLKIVHQVQKFDYDFDLGNLDLSNLKRIKFFGGEPFFSDLHVKILKQIPNPQQVDVWYTSNVSILPSKEVLDVWNTFKLVYLEASIDGVAEQFEYIRWPLLWDKVQENLFELRTNGPVNLLFRINHTLNPFNIYYYDRLENWFEENLKTNRLGDISEINIHPCWGTWGLGRTPILLRRQIEQKYDDHYIVKLLNQAQQLDYQPILNFTNQWDPVRKNNWRTVFPDIVKYFDQ